MLVYAPVGAALAALGDLELAVIAGAAVLWLAMLPDVDLRIPLVSHRGPTHSLLFAGIVGVGFGWIGADLGAKTGVSASIGFGVAGFLVGFLAVGAHLVADTLTPSGVNYFWPLSGKRYSISLWRADSTLANYGLLALGTAALVGTTAILARAGVL